MRPIVQRTEEVGETGSPVGRCRFLYRNGPLKGSAPGVCQDPTFGAGGSVNLPKAHQTFPETPALRLWGERDKAET